MTDAAMHPDRDPAAREHTGHERPGHGPAAHDPAEHDEHDHPGVWTYVVVAFALTILTGLEVAVFYIPALEVAILPILMTLTTGKFILVVMFYMHLKMDSKVFTGVFLAPLLLAMFLVVSMIILFKVLPLYTT